MMTPVLIDSHTHLSSSAFEEDVHLVVQRAREAGVTRLISVGASDGFSSNEETLSVAEQFPNAVWTTVGIHPHDAALELDIARLQDLAAHPSVVAIGETGLDFYRDWSPIDRQKLWFREQIQLAKELHMPLIIHSREAGAECLAILQEEGADEVGGVFHCYAEDSTFAKKIWELGFFVSFPGVVTFKNAHSTHTAAKEIPLEQILVETDAPYLAPVPFRGERCESFHVVETAKKIADLKGLSFAEVAETTTANTEKLFNLTETKQEVL